jgi:hypothetical protein
MKGMVFEKKIVKNCQKLLETILNWNVKLYFICNMSRMYYVAILTIVIQNIKFLCVGSLPNI